MFKLKHLLTVGTILLAQNSGAECIVFDSKALDIHGVLGGKGYTVIDKSVEIADATSGKQLLDLLGEGEYQVFLMEMGRGFRMVQLIQKRNNELLIKGFADGEKAGNDLLAEMPKCDQ